MARLLQVAPLAHVRQCLQFSMTLWDRAFCSGRDDSGSRSVKAFGSGPCWPIGRHVAGGPVGPDKTLLGLDPLEHSALDHAETILGLDPLEHLGLDHAEMILGLEL